VQLKLHKNSTKIGLLTVRKICLISQENLHDCALRKICKKNIYKKCPDNKHPKACMQAKAVWGGAEQVSALR
jgi:hypothetical protein